MKAARWAYHRPFLTGSFEPARSLTRTQPLYLWSTSIRKTT